jgi:hypothetical protein
MKRDFDFYDEPALLHRLSVALKRRPQEVVFLLGAALSEPARPGAPGVLGTAELIEHIRHEFIGDSEQQRQFEHAIRSAGHKRYQAAFSFLQGRLGQPTANEIVRTAVLASRLRQSTTLTPSVDVRFAKDEDLRQLE